MVLQIRLPNPWICGYARDVRTLWAIRRSSLDACRAREPGTVRGNFNRMRADYRDARSMYSEGKHARGGEKVEYFERERERGCEKSERGCEKVGIF